MRVQRFVLPLFCILSHACVFTVAADCKTATVGQPFSTCFDIYTNAKITAAQFASFNPGLNCSTLQIGQKVCISAGTLPSGAPKPQANGTCAEYTTVAGDSCSAIATKFHITVAQIEQFNAKTFHWKGCSALQVAFTMCVSSGNPPPIPIIPGLECGPQSKGNATCPLNACCSAFGFCGLTNDFCTTSAPNPCISNCFFPAIPNCSTSRSIRKIGYYAGWGDRRTCGVNVSPDEIDWTGFTGVHFAFAAISQGLQIQLNSADVPLLKSLVAQKANHPGMKVIIAVGGWDFSEQDPTKDLFSVTISSSTNRATFISSVKSFLSEFGLDGIDIDFEYPSAVERGAPPTDTPNLTAFFQELRTALGSSVVISCATPAGYWFLRGFEINKIAQSVTYLNMMSYDYHGPWDTNVTGQAPVTNPHTSILDMHDSASLYLRAGIDLSKVNLGLAYYGRTYHLQSVSCKGYNCTMTGGGAAGPCTTTAGILSQFEIEDLLKTGITPTLDSKTETYWLDNNGSLVTFDQQDTWAAKTTFAEATCFGGTFIWSLDQKTDNLIDGGSGSGTGVQISPTFTSVEWNPNPFPSPGAASETFIQKPGTALTTFTTTVGSPTTSTMTTTLTIPAFTSTTTHFTGVSGTIKTVTGTTVIPATTTAITISTTFGSTVTSTSLVTLTATTVVIPVPTTTTSVVIQGLTITLNSGGTPVNSPVPAYITQPSAITPTWTQNISPPPNATIVVFTAPLTSTETFATTVPVPPKSTSPAETVTGPPGDRSRCSSSNIWTLLFHAIIGGCLPVDVGIRNGITPTPIRPPGWTGPWVDPFPLPTGGPPPDSEPSPTSSQTTSTTSSTTSSTSSCPTRDPSYDFPDDPENADTDDLGTDPDERRRRGLGLKPTMHTSEIPPEIQTKTDVLMNETLQRRAGPRTASIPGCGLTITSPQVVTLKTGPYLYVPFNQNGGSGTTLVKIPNSGKPRGPPNFVQSNQEHVFEIGYINQFFTFLAVATGCDWIERDVVDYTRVQGLVPSNLGKALIASIDNEDNMVWVDKPMNQAKSNVVNNNRLTAAVPPQVERVLGFVNFPTSRANMIKSETFIRNFAALAQYFEQTGDIFKTTAGNFMTLLSEVTPGTIPDTTRSLPAIFREWLNLTLIEYPSGCTVRANNIWNAYHNKMTQIAITTNNGQVPNCFPLYNTNNYQPSSFNYKDLLPPAPNLPSCNVPGTEGTVGYVSGSNVVRSLSSASVAQERIMGSRNLDYYAVGSGTSLTGLHYQASDASKTYGSACNNVALIFEAAPGTATDAHLDLQCGAATGPQEVNFNFVVNGQSLGCVAVNGGGSAGTVVTLFCATSQGNALNCARVAAPTNTPVVVQMRWFPA